MRRRPSAHLTRRRLLQSLGVSMALSPLIPLLNASGQEATRPKRLILLFTPDGMAARDWNTVVDWKPQGTETDFTFHDVHTPLDAFKSKIVVPWGLTMSAGGAGEAHAFGMAGLWSGATLNQPHQGADFDGGNGNRTGWGSGITVDQLVAQASNPAAPYQTLATDTVQQTRYRTVELGVQTGNPTSLTRMIYAGDKQPIHPETDPRKAFNRLFDGVTPSASPAPTAPVEDPAAVRQRVEQKALVDRLKGDLTRLRGKVGAAEYQKLDKHLEGLLALERRIEGPPSTSLAVGCTLPAAPPEAPMRGGASYPDQIGQMIDVLAHALACDVTRVASLQLSYGFSNVTHTWLGQNIAHHTMSHDGADHRAELQAIDKWYATQIATLLQKLDSVSEGDGTLLDNTLIVWGRELGSTAHRMERVPLILAGGAAGALAGGRNLGFDKQPHAKLLVSIANLMGVDVNGIGDREPDSGPLAGLG